MEFSLFIPLMVAAIQSAGEVLSSAVAKVKDVADKHIFDKSFVENVVSSSNDQLANLLLAVASNVKQEMRAQSVTDAVQELQADILVLGKLLDLANTSELNPAIAERLMPNALIPLQKSLEKAQMRLKQYGMDDMSSYCHIVGTSTLIAGYAYLGQSMPTLQKDLEGSIRQFQKHLLDEIAQVTIQGNMRISWDEVPHLLTVEGIDDLYKLYNSATSHLKPSPVEPSPLEPSPPKSPSKPSHPKPGKKVEDDQGKTASKIHNLYSDTTYCSECKYEVKKSASSCPHCHSRFTKDIIT